ncbi:septation protein A [Thiohalobacter thiocyanaticus]|uniref:Inner membrane-spanning protein YciB n=1 Tax=Thiohalobacter thiocyanaticus TaxID=585455 RepID=A0A426QN28_9GAMM|nr:septation protein A [Thiohalobacter thiocyanaticus]RRQ23149.1 septation protein A [Thiohalobacter thiocyanaticus]
MKFIFDFMPILLFFVAYKVYDIYVATAVAIVATLVMVAVFWLRHRRVEKMHLITLAIIGVFGGATLALQDPTFIMWKPTIAYWLFALVFLGSQYIGGRSITERMMGHAITAPARVWTGLNLSWVVFFVVMGILNLYVAYNFAEDTWVNFKLFGLMSLSLIFILGQGIIIARYASNEDKGEEES